MRIPTPRGAPRPRHPALLLLVAVLAAWPLASAAQSLERHAFSGGAADGTGGGLRLRGTLGEAGFVGQTAGPILSLSEGFWARAFFSIASDAPGSPGTAPAFVNELLPGFPNPFRDATTFAFGVERPSAVRFRLFDVTGRRVATLLDEGLPAGRHELRWTGRDDLGRSVASGVYFYRLDIGDWSRTERVLKLR